MDKNLIYVVFILGSFFLISSCSLIKNYAYDKYSPRYPNNIKSEVIRKAGFNQVEMGEIFLGINIPTPKFNSILHKLITDEFNEIKEENDSEIEFIKLKIDTIITKEQSVALTFSFNLATRKENSLNNKWYAGVKGIEGRISCMISSAISNDTIYFEPNIYDIKLDQLKVRLWKIAFNFKSVAKLIEELQYYINDAVIKAIKKNVFIKIEYKPIKSKYFSELIKTNDLVTVNDYEINYSKLRIRHSSILIDSSFVKVMVELNSLDSNVLSYDHLHKITRHPFNFYEFMLLARFNNLSEPLYNIDTFSRDGERYIGVSPFDPRQNRVTAFSVPLLPLDLHKDWYFTNDQIVEMYAGLRKNFLHKWDTYFVIDGSDDEVSLLINKKSLSKTINYLLNDFDYRGSSNLTFSGELSSDVKFKVFSISCDDSFLKYCEAQYWKCVDDCDGPKIGRDVCKALCLADGWGHLKCLLNATADIASCSAFLINEIVDLDEIRMGKVKIEHHTNGVINLSVNKLEFDSEMSGVNIGSKIFSNADANIDLEFTPRAEGWLLCQIPFDNFKRYECNISANHLTGLSAQIEYQNDMDSLKLKIIPNKLSDISINMSPSIAHMLLTDPAFYFSCNVLYNSIFGAMLLYKGTNRFANYLGADTKIGNVLNGLFYGDYLIDEYHVSNFEVNIEPLYFEEYKLIPENNLNQIRFKIK